MAYELRPYQEENFHQLRTAYAKGHFKVLYQAATGSGKTVVASMVAKMAAEKGRLVMPVAHRRELIYQFAEKLAGIGLFPGIIMAGEPISMSRQIQVGSIQTLWARFLKDKGIGFFKPDLIIIDEAHRSLSATYLKLMEAFPNAWVLGLTATPVRTDGRGLGHVYEEMVCSPSVKELTDMGYLVPVIPYGGSTPDLTGIKMSGFDYSQVDLEDRSNKPKLVGDCVQNWIRHANNRPTFAFATGVKHSIALAEAYMAAGIPAMHVDANTHVEDRDQVLARLVSGEIKVVTNCMVYTEGTDCPAVSCVQLANSTKSIGKFLQMAGRGMRPHDESGKEDMILLDHANATMQHGFVEDPIPWELSATGKLHERLKESRAKESKQFECMDCGHIWSGKIRCPMCGRKLELMGEMAEYSEEDLVNLKRAKPKAPVYTNKEKQMFYSELLGYASGMGRKSKKAYSHGWAAHKYRAKFGVWPRGMDEHLAEPSALVKAFIRSQNIRYAKRKVA